MFDVYWIKQTTEKIDKQNLSRIVKDFLRLSLYFLECIFLVQKKSFLFVFQFLSVPMFRNITMKCLTEIASVTVTHYDEKFVGELT